jgi:hypothetical protein
MGEQKTRRRLGLPGSKQAASVVEMQVAEHHVGNRRVVEAVALHAAATDAGPLEACRGKPFLKLATWLCLISLL